MINATAGVFDISNAFCSGSARVAMDSPGRSGVAMPMAPLRRRTGTTGVRVKGHMLLSDP